MMFIAWMYPGEGKYAGANETLWRSSVLYGLCFELDLIAKHQHSCTTFALHTDFVLVHSHHWHWTDKHNHQDCQCSF